MPTGRWMECDGQRMELWKFIAVDHIGRVLAEWHAVVAEFGRVAGGEILRGRPVAPLWLRYMRIQPKGVG